MNEQEITKRLVAAHTALVGKMGGQPKIEPSVRLNQSGEIGVTIYGRINYDQIGYAKGETFEDCLYQLDFFIAAMPDPEAAKLHAHMRRVADCIDKGREDGIDDAYITPLVVVKAAMTENLLTKGDVK